MRLGMAGIDDYRRVDLHGRVAGADRHGLIGLLYAELLEALSKAAGAAQRGDREAASRASTRALSVLGGLTDSLDRDRGGEVAAILGSLYGRSVATTIAALRTLDAAGFRGVHDRIADVAEAWASIAPDRRP
jgi:flagellar protein FliS